MVHRIEEEETVQTEPKIEHGVAEACYANGSYGFRPFVQCSCGWSTSEDNWEDAGREFDDHLLG